MSEESPPTLAPTDDLKLAAVAAGCTVGLTLLLQFGLDRDVSFLVRLVPLLPYFAYVFTRRVDFGALDTVRNWSALTLAVTVLTLLYYAV
ncbi:hypothetical protein C474_02286 [Halogeometricum pallidum JCM 14848]|uniref:DUF8049 domain-containing protein n=1 Tax=Halogeometricum pallidum JCM 14848 TaxID=1227487 RepID=M0DGA2_HALPD|nr:hypothetical protein [Halogeometricum pallidum]ELZ34496.1 hypothetical protein C474_02286 [Halogeometricum pallidum JCM 14848]